MNTATPSARMLLDYVADVTLVTAADVAAYFDLSNEVAAECMAKVGLVSPDADGTFEIPDACNADPDDALDAFAERYGVDYPDTPLADVPSNPAPSISVEEAKASAPAPKHEPTPKGDGTEIGDPDHEVEVVTEDAPADVDLVAEVASLRAEVAELRAMVEALTVAGVKPSKAKAKKKTTKRKPTKKPTLAAMLTAGTVKVGDEVEIQGETAKLAEGRAVKLASGESVSINRWALDVTGWQSCNVYNNVRHVPTGLTLEALRVSAQATA